MNFYDIMGVSRTATGDEIHKAYRKLAMKYHPDRNPGNEEAAIQFKKVQEAYDTLSDPNKRSRYDGDLLKGTAKPNARPRNRPDAKNKRPYSGDGFVFRDAPEPKFDLWGEPILPEHKWVDAYSNHYEKDGQPDIRGI